MHQFIIMTECALIVSVTYTARIKMSLYTHTVDSPSHKGNGVYHSFYSLITLVAIN